MNIDDLTVGQAKELAQMFGRSQCCEHGWEVGENYLIRTVTMIDTDKLVAVTEHELVLEDAAWIPDTGRFSEAIKKAQFKECEPFPSGRVIVGRGAIVDAVRIEVLPRSLK